MKEKPCETLSIDYNFNTKMLEEHFFKVKSNLKNLLYATDIHCCVCLESARSYFHLLDFSNSEEQIEACTAEGMMRLLFVGEDLKNLLSKYICNICIESLKQAYHFVAGVINISKVMNSCLDQMNEQIDAAYNEIESTGNFLNTVLVIENYIHTPVSNLIKEMPMENENFEDAVDNYESNEEATEIPAGIDSNVLICDICGKSFQCTSAIIYHMTNMHREKKLSQKAKIKSSCSECATRPCVHERYLVAAFDQQKLGLKRYKCLDCDHSTTKKTNLISHVNKHHLNINPHLCEICGRSFPSALMHKLHINQHYSGRIRCEYCDLIIKQNHALHTLKCQTILRSYKCESCSASFDDAEMLKMHDKRRHKKSHTCPICFATFSQVTGLWIHKRDCHKQSKGREVKCKRTGNLLNKCDFCPKQCITWVELKNHLAAEHADAIYKCNVCSKIFSERKKYKAHMNSAPHLVKQNPNTLLTFQCDKCDFSCASAWNLENHTNLIHLQIKPYKCEICSKDFTTRFHLKNHLSRHAGIRNYQCTICNTMMTTLSSLKKHIYRHHEKPENWPFRCEMCEKTFVCASERSFHQKQAHNEKDEPCPICKTCFHTRSMVRNHVSRVHVKGKAPKVAEFLRANRHNKELMELFRDRRKPYVDNSTNFSLTV